MQLAVLLRDSNDEKGKSACLCMQMPNLHYAWVGVRAINGAILLYATVCYCVLLKAAIQASTPHSTYDVFAPCSPCLPIPFPI